MNRSPNCARCWTPATTATSPRRSYISSKTSTPGFKRTQPRLLSPTRPGQVSTSGIDGVLIPKKPRRLTATSATASMCTPPKLRKRTRRRTRSAASNCGRASSGTDSRRQPPHRAARSSRQQPQPPPPSWGGLAARDEPPQQGQPVGLAEASPWRAEVARAGAPRRRAGYPTGPARR